MNAKKCDSCQTWLCHIVKLPETGSEGYSSFMYSCIAHGNTDKEILDSYVKNVKAIYDVDLENNIKKGTDGSIYIDWFQIVKFPVLTEQLGIIKITDDYNLLKE